MTRTEAITSLDASSSHERLGGARALISIAEKDDLQFLRKARRAETVVLVQRALDRAIARLEESSSTLDDLPTPELDIPADVKRHFETKAVEWIAGMLLHELAGPLGLVEWAASRDVADYAASDTKKHLDRLKHVFEAVEQLKGATALPRQQEFELADLIKDIIASDPRANNIDVSLHGPIPLIVRSDPDLLRLALSNGIRNALDAVSEIEELDAHSVVVAWGETNSEYWVSVIDSGPGLQGSPELAFEIGKSTKSKHTGFGLTIARHAMASLSGTVTLQSAATKGACYEARWPK